MANIIHRQEDNPEGGLITVVADLIVVTFSIFYAIFRSFLNPVLRFVGYKRYKNIRNEIVLITGGGKGLGRVLAVEFAKFTPRHIVLWGRHADSLGATAKAVRIYGVACTFMVCDVSDPDQVAEQAKLVLEEVGNVTILVNNAGCLSGKSVIDSSAESICRTIGVNTLGQFWTIKEFLPDMLTNDHGHIVSINSTLGKMGLAGAADYCASKYANRALSESVFLEVLREKKMGVHVTNVYPGQTNTDMFAGVSHSDTQMVRALAFQQLIGSVSYEAFRDMLNFPSEVVTQIITDSILPTEVTVLLYRLIGMDKAMNGFRGEAKHR